MLQGYNLDSTGSSLFNPSECHSSGAGPGTIIANFAFLQCDKIIEELIEFRSNNVSEEAVREFLLKRGKDIDVNTREKLYLLSLGKTPQDDFSSDDIIYSNQPNAQTLNVELSKIDTSYRHGSLVFFEGKRWIVAYLEGNRMRLKLF